MTYDSASTTRHMTAFARPWRIWHMTNDIWHMTAFARPWRNERHNSRQESTRPAQKERCLSLRKLCLVNSRMRGALNFQRARTHTHCDTHTHTHTRCHMQASWCASLAGQGKSSTFHFFLLVYSTPRTLDSSAPHTPRLTHLLQLLQLFSTPISLGSSAYSSACTLRQSTTLMGHGINLRTYVTKAKAEAAQPHQVDMRKYMSLGWN